VRGRAAAQRRLPLAQLRAQPCQGCGTRSTPGPCCAAPPAVWNNMRRIARQRWEAGEMPSWFDPRILDVEEAPVRAPRQLEALPQPPLLPQPQPPQQQQPLACSGGGPGLGPGLCPGTPAAMLPAAAWQVWRLLAWGAPAHTQPSPPRPAPPRRSTPTGASRA
jgi:hypothetical protein